METCIGILSQSMCSARKHKGIIHATNGWKKVTLRTLRKRSMENGANHESRCGGRSKPPTDAMLGIRMRICRSAMMRRVRFWSLVTLPATLFLKMLKRVQSPDVLRECRVQSRSGKKVFGQDGLLATAEKFPLTQDSHVETIEWPRQVSAQTPDDARPRPQGAPAHPCRPAHSLAVGSNG